MRNRFRIFLALALAALVAGILAMARRTNEASYQAAARPAATAAASPVWEISGIFTEACECAPPCPCWWGKMPTQHHCHNVQVYKIQKGHYGSVSLDELIVVVAVVSPEGKIMDESAGKSILAAMYVDRSTTGTQRRAIQEIWRESLLKGVKGNKGGFKAVRFSVAEVAPEHARVSIPGILSFEVRNGSGEPMNVQYPYMHGMRLGQSVEYRYLDYGMTWNEPGRHAAFATFQAQSPPSFQPKK